MKPNSRFTGALLVIGLVIAALGASAQAEDQTQFKQIPLQYIVALGDPAANSGSGAEQWGLWTQDPGPRGCRLENYGELKDTGVAPAQWAYDSQGNQPFRCRPANTW